MDLSALSDADLHALADDDLSKVSDEGLLHLQEQMKAAEAPPAPAPEEPESWGHYGIRKALPIAGTVAGSLGGAALGGGVGAIPGAAAGNVAGNEGASWLNHEIYGDKAPTYNSLDDAKRVGIESAEGAAAEVGGQIIGKITSPITGKLGEYLSGLAEKQAVKATGATAVQASKFPEGTGRALLDNGAVKFGRSQGQIADSAANTLDQQGDVISKAIEDITKKGGATSRDEMLAGIDQKIAELDGNPAQAPVIKQLQSIKEDIASGPEHPTMSQIEDAKRGFQGLVNWSNPEGNAAKAAAADVYKTAGENIAKNTDTEAGQQFFDAKKLYSQLKPAADASERRALQLQQSPIGDLLDVASYGVAGAPGVIARKTITPRISSSMASTANSLSQVLSKNPSSFGKWAPILAKRLSEGGESSLNATDYILQQSDPGYRQMRDQMNQTSNK